MERPTLTVNMTMFVVALSMLEGNPRRRALTISFDGRNMLLSCGGTPTTVSAEGDWPSIAKVQWKSLPRIKNDSRPIFPKAEITLVGYEEEIDIGGLKVPCTWEKSAKPAKPRASKPLTKDAQRDVDEASAVLRGRHKIFTKDVERK